MTVNKVVDRQNLKSTVNKLTVTFDHSTIIGNDLSASFGTGWLTTMFTFIINLSSYHVMQPLLSTVHLLFLVLTCTATLNLKGGKVIDYLMVIDGRRLSSDCYTLVTSSRAPTLAPYASLFTPFSIFKPRLIFIADSPLFLTHCDSIPVMTPLYF